MTERKLPADKIKAIAERERAKRKGALAIEPQDLTLPAAAITPLPSLPAIPHGVPNAFLRSALFGAIRPGRPRYLERERLASVEGIDLIYTGARLDQGHFTLWQALIEVIRGEPLGAKIALTAYEILKRLNKSDTGTNRKLLEKRLSRLSATSIDLTLGPVGYEGSLIVELTRNKESKVYTITLNPAMRRLFEGDQWTAVDWAVRQDLEGHPLAQWLHGFYSSHAKPFPVSPEKLFELCGSDAQGRTALSDFRHKTLPKALDQVRDACAKHDQSFAWRLNDHGLVEVTRSGSASQRKSRATRALRGARPRLPPPA